jgi:hypothetical protein
MRVASTSVARWAWAGVVGLTAVVSALALASANGLIEAGLARRLIGVGLGLMILHVGNLLPKLRPLGGMPGAVLAVERFSGWLLALAGIAWIMLFSLAPLGQANRVAAVIGCSALLILAVRWGALAWAAWSARRRQGTQPPVEGGEGASGWRPASWVLFAFFYVLAIACVKFLVEQKQLASELSMWILAGFWLMYAAVSAAFDHRRAC